MSDTARRGSTCETTPDERSKGEPQVITKTAGRIPDGDERPIFVLDLKSPAIAATTRTIPVYQNASLQMLDRVGVAVSQGTGAEAHKSSVADSTQTRLLLDWATSKPELVN
ncbi:hypothetical protein HYALB_00010501 [Hymenoscyphus albidus]|uniref:PAS-like domain-containing protein n=1 Tax=Hymenoscyphus albidus TaxID=595503 RepID=A0A9N9Q4H6_9HELO|nr:hypothetical protein HYALB_00010501 [Hymenoscyphus albidus]